MIHLKKRRNCYFLKNYNMDIVMDKMDSVLRNDVFIAAYDVLIQLLKYLKKNLLI